MRKRFLISLAFLAFGLFSFSGTAFADEYDPPSGVQDKPCDIGPDEVIGCPKAEEHGDQEKGISFAIKPGSGWLLSGVSLLVSGSASLIIGGAVFASQNKDNPFSGLGESVGTYFYMLPGTVMFAAGIGMLGYGISQNYKFDRDQIAYESPAIGYIAGGAIDLAIGGLSCVVMNLGVGIPMLAFGIGFLSYGLATDFQKKFNEQSKAIKVLGSLAPYVGCTGGMCDGNTNRATGRETYFAGIRGEF